MVEKGKYNVGEYRQQKENIAMFLYFYFTDFHNLFIFSNIQNGTELWYSTNTIFWCLSLHMFMKTKVD